MSRTAPVTGNARWISAKLLAITPTGGEEQVYEVEETRTGYRLHCHTQMVRTGEFKFYTLDRHAGSVFMCNCPDATHRRALACDCKHAKGLAAALRAAF